MHDFDKLIPWELTQASQMGQTLTERGGARQPQEAAPVGPLGALPGEYSRNRMNSPATLRNVFERARRSSFRSGASRSPAAADSNDDSPGEEPKSDGEGSSKGCGMRIVSKSLPQSRSDDQLLLQGRLSPVVSSETSLISHPREVFDSPNSDLPVRKYEAAAVPNDVSPPDTLSKEPPPVKYEAAAVPNDVSPPDTLSKDSSCQPPLQCCTRQHARSVQRAN